VGVGCRVLGLGARTAPPPLLRNLAVAVQLGQVLADYNRPSVVVDLDNVAERPVVVQLAGKGGAGSDHHLEV